MDNVSFFKYNKLDSQFGSLDTHCGYTNTKYKIGIKIKRRLYPKVQTLTLPYSMFNDRINAFTYSRY